jgi:iron complex outermembrane recepter protein
MRSIAGNCGTCRVRFEIRNSSIETGGGILNMRVLSQQKSDRLNRKLSLLLIGTAFLAVPAVGHAQTASDRADQLAGSGNSLEEIIVTANRRRERSQDVPVAITAFSAEKLTQLNITSTQDLQTSVPGLVVGSNGQQSRESQTPTLRGQGATFQASPGVVMYLNEVPLPSPISLSQQGGPGNFVDLENVQVLAGPQGTLFGRNTTGGAVLLVPHKPTNDFGGYLQGKYGNYDDTELEGVVNIPVIDETLLVRVVGAYQDRDGFTRDIVWNKNRDDKHWYSGRIGITFRPTERIDNYLMAYGSYSRFNGTGHINRGFNIDGPNGLAQLGLCSNTPISVTFTYSCDVYRAATAQADELGPRATAHGVDDFQRTKTWGVSDTLSYELSDQLTLRNIISYQRFKSFFSADTDGTVLQQYDYNPTIYPEPGQATLPGVGTPITYLNASSNTLPQDYYKLFTEELQLQGSMLNNKLIFTAGGFYYNQTPAGPSGGSAISYCPGVLTGTPVPATFNPDGSVASGAACVPSQAPSYVANKSYALYAQGTFDLGALTPTLDSLRLTAGFRYTWDKIRGFSASATPTLTGLFICSATNEVFDDPSNCAFFANLSSKAPTWTLGLDYRPVPELMVFGKISRGYKAGGFNSFAVRPDTRTFDPEKVTNYEAGFKSDFRIAGMPTRFNATAYYLDYSNIQKATGDFNILTGSSGARINPAQATVKGVELDATMRPIPAIEIGATFSHTDFHYTDYSLPSNGFLPDCSGVVQPAGSPNDLTCLKGQYVVPYNYSVRTTITLPIPESLGQVTLFVSYSHNSAQHTEAVVVPPFQPGERLEAFGLLNASLDWRNIGGSTFDAGLFVTNATNDLYRISNTDVFQGGSLLTQSTIYGEPRMYGLRLRYSFGS